VELGQKLGFERFHPGGHFGNKAFFDRGHAIPHGVDAFAQAFLHDVGAFVQMTLHSRE